MTNDIKERGPHYTLMRTPDSEIIPFSFFEVLLLDYLEGRLTEGEFCTTYAAICDLSNLKWDMRSKIKAFLRRFWITPYREMEKEWMKAFCEDKRIDARVRLESLSKHK